MTFLTIVLALVTGFLLGALGGFCAAVWVD